MLVEIRAKNCFVFDREIALSMKADMRQKKLSYNVHKTGSFNTLKTVGVYGANNAGKTCLLKTINVIRGILLDIKVPFMPNIFTEDPVIELGVTFLSANRMFSYDIKIDSSSNEYIYEKFAEIEKDKYGNEKEIVWFLKDTIGDNYCCLDQDVLQMVPMVAKNKPFYHLIDTDRFFHLNEMKNILMEFAEKIDYINMNNIPIQHTIDLLKNRNNIRNKVVEFIKNADLYMDNFEYVDLDRVPFSYNESMLSSDETVLNIPEKLMDQMRLVSTYKGKQVPSMVFDSTGTKKISALASYVIEALEQGRILVIDELDSSIHFKLTRAIAAMFNNELNHNAQLIFTVHDINLMDCKKLFRKEQIWFVHKDNDGVYVYSLADFTAQQGVRDTTDVIEKYQKGALGALPDPELINTLLDITEYNREDSMNGK